SELDTPRRLGPIYTHFSWVSGLVSRHDKLSKHMVVRDPGNAHHGAQAVVRSTCFAPSWCVERLLLDQALSTRNRPPVRGCAVQFGCS
ncbi:MAG: hypothetical protein JWR85_345, partial [Marmoricola sp.]|nr:hypothetical protein [Marmoricola sp.]